MHETMYDDIMFVPLSEVIRGSGVSEPTVRARLRAVGIPLFSHPFDGRRKLVRRVDLARLVQPLPPVTLKRKDDA